jgi:hypothetical protein
MYGSPASGTDAVGTTVVTDVCRLGAYRIADVLVASHPVAVGAVGSKPCRRLLDS